MSKKNLSSSEMEAVTIGLANDAAAMLAAGRAGDALRIVKRLPDLFGAALGMARIEAYRAGQEALRPAFEIARQEVERRVQPGLERAFALGLEAGRAGAEAEAGKETVR